MSQNRNSLAPESGKNTSGNQASKPPCSKLHTPTPGASTNGGTQATQLPKKITETAKKDLIANSQSTIKDRRSAEKWLTDSSYSVKGEPLSIAALGMALLYISTGNIVSYAGLIDGMRAIAICLLDQQPKEDTKEIANEIIEAAKDAIDEAIIEAKENLAAVTENCLRSMEEATEKRKERVEKGKEGTTEEGEWEEGNTQRGPPMSYADAAARKQEQILFTTQTPGPKWGDEYEETTTKEEKRRREEIMEREAKREKQILIDNVKDWEKVTEGEMVKRANEAWRKIEETVEEEMGIDKETIEIGGRFVAARKLKNGGIIMEASTDLIITWLHDLKVKAKFEEEMEGGAEVKERLYTLIIEFASTSLKYTLPTANRMIEEANEMDEGAIFKIRWMRDPEKSWGETQTKAHAVLTTKDQIAANNIIRKSLIIEGKRHTARKIEDDPRRCYKCQRFDTGHTAATCRGKQTCANCNETDHDTGECRAPREAHRCASCTEARRDNRHASWSRKCPIFIRHQIYLRDKYPENHYKYYPNKYIPWTWEKKTDCEVEETEKEGETSRWTGSYDRKRHEEERSRRWQERAQDRGYGEEIGGGWATRKKGRVGGDYYRPITSRSRSRGRRGGRPAEANERESERTRHEEDHEQRKGGTRRSRSRSRGDNQRERSTNGEREKRRSKGRTEKSKERGGADKRVGDDTTSQRTLPASWSRPRANTTGETRRKQHQETDTHPPHMQ